MEKENQIFGIRAIIEAVNAKKEIDIIRKAMWRLLDEFILIKKVGNNDKSKSI